MRSAPCVVPRWNPHLAVAGVQVWSVTSRDLVSRLEAEAEQRMAALTSEHAPGLDVERAARVGAPYSEIVRYASENGIDLIVMGTHGRVALPHLLLGSVAERVVRRAGCAVLTVRRAGSETYLVRHIGVKRARAFCFSDEAPLLSECLLCGSTVAILATGSETYRHPLL